MKGMNGYSDTTHSLQKAIFSPEKILLYCSKPYPCMQKPTFRMDVLQTKMTRFCSFLDIHANLQVLPIQILVR